MKENLALAMNRFLEYLQIEKNYSSYTVEFYKKDIEHFSLFMQEQSIATFNDVKYFDARLYVSSLYERHYARTSAARKISSLRSFFKFLLREKIVDENPFILVIQPKKGVRLPSFLYEEEMEQLFSSCDDRTPLGKRNLALMELLYATGIRVSECANIQLDDVDFDLSTILVKGKGKRERYVPFGIFASQALESYINGARSLLFDRSDHRNLFVNARGGPLTARGIRHVLNEVMKKASLSGKIHPHMFRHSFATHMLNNGADMRTVQELLGHTHLSSTQVYTHVTKEHLRKTYINSHPRA
ncbi:MAG TPA: tyrosine recombinase XerC [Bacillus bacterium]|uniref:Tyrosine recombinase XerC n=1 Tax=Siminovitchia fordii TaxID=254759 RepID=A0ABQ4JZI2_9BACI|nr:tyrosine recombinase XerC [Siminovitchia fordii]GIN18953.1 tyrosine recombinase XerC [Siminovitchia fordii]HBZ10432.1 tyrosine recombinase XerC [Bacillus sp. (in: firmicutes)]